MTDRIKGFTVILDKDYRDDDFEFIKSAVEMIKGVKSVEPYISNGSEYITEMRIQSEIREFIRKNL